MLNYYGAHTGRASGGDKMNLQNLPRGGVLRHAMKAPAGHSMVACDSAQIEARVVAWLAGEDGLVSDFTNGVDIYSKFASNVYGVEVTKATHPKERFVGKTATLGLGFGMGKDKFKASLRTSSESVDMSIDEAERVVHVYRSTYPKIAGLWKQADQALKAMASGNTFHLGTGILLTCDSEGIHLPNGMKLKYHQLSYRAADGEKIKKDGYYYDTRYGPVGIYGAKMIENVVQALARIVVFNQMAKIDQKLRKHDSRTKGVRFKVALTVHDEVVVICPSQAEKKVQKMMEDTMKVAPKWADGLPISCESAVGQSYGECK
jgi:DNA polymerase